eukprot:g66993.t1
MWVATKLALIGAWYGGLVSATNVCLLGLSGSASFTAEVGASALKALKDAYAKAQMEQPDNDGLENANKDCWSSCGDKSGPCAWCGPQGLCCRKAFNGGEGGCPADAGGEQGHVCVKLPRTPLPLTATVLSRQPEQVTAYAGMSFATLARGSIFDPQDVARVCRGSSLAIISAPCCAIISAPCCGQHLVI